MQAYLKSTDIIDWKHPLVLEQALELSNNLEFDCSISTHRMVPY